MISNEVDWIQPKRESVNQQIGLGKTQNKQCIETKSCMFIFKNSKKVKIYIKKYRENHIQRDTR